MTTPRYSSVLPLVCALSVCFLWAGPVRAMGGPKPPPGAASALNVILLIGDGMGPLEVEAARIMAGGELALDLLDPAPAFVTTHNIDGKITDSAAAATALATGFKTANGNISMAADDVTPLPTSMELARDNGMATGIVSNVYVQDATPGVWVAHWFTRDGRAIAAQQVDAGVDVLLGSGSYYMLSERFGSRTDGRNLIQEMVDAGYTFVDTRDELNAVGNPGPVGLLGIFGSVFSMEYVLDRSVDHEHSPTVVEMAAKAIDVLDGRSKNGFFLVVEGAYPDYMGHNRGFPGQVAETLEFDELVQLALNFAADDGNTLVVATADHETGGLKFKNGLNYNVPFVSGITCTGSFMWGLIKQGMMTDDDIRMVMGDCGIKDLTMAELDKIHACGDQGSGRGISNVVSDRAGVEWGSSGCKGGTHSDALVEVYAFGPGAEQFDGIVDNTDIGELLFDVVSGN